jgi:hypothetical protein
MRCVELAETRILAKERNAEDWIFRSSLKYLPLNTILQRNGKKKGVKRNQASPFALFFPNRNFSIKPPWLAYTLLQSVNYLVLQYVFRATQSNQF